MTEKAAGSSERCDRCEEECKETSVMYRDGRVWATLCTDCHDVLAEEVLQA